MYVYPAFKADWATSLAFAAARGFGLVIAGGEGDTVASPLPFTMAFADDGTPRVGFHVARANDLARLAAGGGRWLVSVMGPDAYVSPRWYASPEQVPTWLYQCVQLAGPVRPMTAAALAEHLDALSAAAERQSTPERPWSVAEVTAGRRQMLMQAIAGIEMAVETVTGNFKLNQHKSDADHVSVAAALAAQAEPSARAIGKCMVAMRPHLDYEPVPALT